MSPLTQDVRYALRAFARSPGFALVAILSLAIGIGANTAIFSVVSALLLRPLPYLNADRQVILWNTSPGLGIVEDWFSTAQYFDIRNNVRSFESVAIAIGANMNLTGDGEPERIGTVRVSSNLLTMLGARPLVGALFTVDDDRPGRTGKAVLGHGTWVRRYGSDPAIVGRSVTLNGQPFEIVGVLPASFSLPREVLPTLGVVEDAEVVLPLPLAANAAEVRNREDYNLVATLAPGSSLGQARSELDALTSRLRREHPDFYPPNGGLTFRALPLKEQAIGRVRLPLVVLVAAVGFVLLIACANVANLLLSRALSRRKEIAVRSALGARSRTYRPAAAHRERPARACRRRARLGLRVRLPRRHPGARSRQRAAPVVEIGVDVRVLLFTLVISFASGLVFGLAPALRLSRLDVSGSLKDADRGSAGTSAVWGRGQNLRRLLVVAELALSVMLLIAAGLLIRSFAHLQRVSPGFSADNVLTLELTMTGRKYNDAEAVLLAYRQLWERLARLPGVAAVGGVTALPLSNMMAWGPITVEGRAAPEGEKFINADIRVVGGDYFTAMNIPLLAGRSFTDQDTRTSLRVVVVDEHMAKQLWPGQDAIGKRIRTGGFDVTPDTPWMTVIGVVGRVKQDSLDGDPRMAYYRYQGQTPSRAMTVAIRGASDPSAMAGAVTRQIRELDPDLPIYKLRTMDERISDSLAERRFSMLLLTVFAALALGLAAIGIYGVMAYLVAQGTRELGIRLALGASPANLRALVVRQGMAVALVGVALGLAGAFALTRFMRALLFGVRETDPLTFAAIGTMLALIALVASYVPARRASRVDPIVSLRTE